MCKDSARTVKKTAHPHYLDQLVDVPKETTAVYSVSHMKPKNTLCVKN